MTTHHQSLHESRQILMCAYIGDIQRNLIASKRAISSPRAYIYVCRRTSMPTKINSGEKIMDQLIDNLMSVDAGNHTN